MKVLPSARSRCTGRSGDHQVSLETTDLDSFTIRINCPSSPLTPPTNKPPAGRGKPLRLGARDSGFAQRGVRDAVELWGLACFGEKQGGQKRRNPRGTKAKRSFFGSDISASFYISEGLFTLGLGFDVLPLSSPSLSLFSLEKERERELKNREKSAQDLAKDFHG